MSGALFKILPAAVWDAASGHVPWSEVDRRDGFVHLSAVHQVRETARRHFTGQQALVLLTIDPAALAPGTLRWEPSRGGDSFPHVYGDLPVGAVSRVDPLPADPGGFRFPSHVPHPS